MPPIPSQAERQSLIQKLLAWHKPNVGSEVPVPPPELHVQAAAMLEQDRAFIASQEEEWTPVTTALPPPSTDVYVIVKQGNSYRQAIAGYFPETTYPDGPHFWLEYASPDQKLEVTHWRRMFAFPV